MMPETLNSLILTQIVRLTCTTDTEKMYIRQLVIVFKECAPLVLRCQPVPVIML